MRKLYLPSRQKLHSDFGFVFFRLQLQTMEMTQLQQQVTLGAGVHVLLVSTLMVKQKMKKLVSTWAFITMFL